uniref:Hyaluronidase n=1 Tax=Strigamia maritima TaxID=126957 RepID=T1JL26_STRMM
MLPIYPYTSIHYRDSTTFMSVEDILITIGQAAALRLPGVIMWGAYANFNSEGKCTTFSNYVHSIFGPTLNKIRESLENNTHVLRFDDGLNEELWAQKIFEFYDYEK